MFSSKIGSFAAAVCLLVRFTQPGIAGAATETSATTPYDQLEWRNVGPVNMSGRVADVEGIPGDPRILYVGAASGGVWKTVDGGLSFAPIFDDQPIASIGDLALAPSNRDVIYVGTGEANVRNSVSFGNGVYKSTDGGQSWRHMGLEDTRHISRIVVHPQNPDIVYVGALGHIFGPNEERGVFRSTDGGATGRRCSTSTIGTGCPTWTSIRRIRTSSTRPSGTSSASPGPIERAARRVECGRPWTVAAAGRSSTKAYRS